MTHGAFVAVIYNAANRPELNQSLHEYLQDRFITATIG